MRVGFITLATALVITSVTALAPAKAQNTGLSDLVGARAGQAERELQRRGYRNVRSQSGDDRNYGYWWNRDRRQCVVIATMDGRFSSINATTAPDCSQSASSDRGSDRYDRDRDRDRYDRDRDRDRYDRDRGRDRDRYVRDRPRRGTSASNLGYAGGTDVQSLQRYCQRVASDQLDYRMSGLYFMSPTKMKRGWIINGYYQPRGTNVWFYCYYDDEGRMTGFTGNPVK